MNNSYKKEKFGTYDGGAKVSQRTQGLDATHPSEPMTHPLDFFRRPGSGIGPAEAGRRGIEDPKPPSEGAGPPENSDGPTREATP